MNKKSSVALIDGYGLLYRAYFAFIKSPLINPQGTNISSLYGFTRMLLRLIQELSFDSLIVTMDSKEKTFRHELFAEYKANRESMPEDLIQQIPLIHNFLELARIPMVAQTGMEADDIMGSLSHQWEPKIRQIFLVTGDKDAYQLVSPTTKILAPQKGIQELQLLDENGVHDKLGVPVSLVIDYMALVGDNSDNIPGVHGIGPKGAIKLLHKFGSLAKIFASLDQVTPANTQQKLRDNRDNAFLSQKLVTIKRDLQLQIEPETYNWQQLFSQEVSDFFQEYGMPSLAQEIAQRSSDPNTHIPKERSKQKRQYTIIKEAKELEQLAKQLKQHSSHVAVDTETTSSHPMEGELLGISLALKPHEAYYIPIRGENSLLQEGLDLSLAQKILNTSWSDKAQLVAQNYKYDYIVLKRHGFDLPQIHLDTMIASYLLAPGERRHNLDNLAQIYLGESMISYDEITKKGNRRIGLAEVPLETVAEYAAEDADITLRLAILLEQELQKEKLWQLYCRLERPLIPILAHMEMRGVTIDRAHFEKLSQSMEQSINDLAALIHSHAGRIFNINSTHELQQILFHELQLPIIKKTKTGYSTDVSVLEALQGRHPIIDALLQYRTLAKLQNTYIEALPNLINKRTGRIHSSFNQAIAATGRLSSSDPNMQNIPVREKTGREIRRGFIAEPGYLILAADYSQIELRILAHFAQDEILLEAFHKEQDIHRLTAGQIFGKSADKVSDEERRMGKTLNFSVIYGQTPFGLSRQLGIPQGQAKEYIDNYFAKYAGVARFKQELLDQAKERGYVTTIMGRKRYINGLVDKNRVRREGAERIAFNTPIQGSASDIIKLAMIQMEQKLAQQKLKAQLILQVHDELLFEIAESQQNKTHELVRKTMEQVVELRLPLKVEAQIAPNWEEAH